MTDAVERLRALAQQMRDRAWQDHNFTQRAHDLAIQWADELDAALDALVREPTPLLKHVESWNDRLEGWMENDAHGYSEAIAVISDVARETHEVLHYGDTQDGSRATDRPNHVGDSRAHQARTAAAGESPLQPRMGEGAQDSQRIVGAEAQPTPEPKSGMLTVVVNGQPVDVPVGSVSSVIQAAINQSGQIGAPIQQWELRTREGDVIPHDLPDDWHLTADCLLFLNLGLPPSRAEAHPTPPPSGWQPAKDGFYPKPGEPVLAVMQTPRPCVVIAQWAPKGTLPLHPDAEGGEYDEARDEYFAEEGWYQCYQVSGSLDDEPFWKITDAVTAWMSLPPVSAALPAPAEEEPRT